MFLSWRMGIKFFLNILECLKLNASYLLTRKFIGILIKIVHKRTRKFLKPQRGSPILIKNKNNEAKSLIFG